MRLILMLLLIPSLLMGQHCPSFQDVFQSYISSCYEKEYLSFDMRIETVDVDGSIDESTITIALANGQTVFLHEDFLRFAGREREILVHKQNKKMILTSIDSKIEQTDFLSQFSESMKLTESITAEINCARKNDNLSYKIPLSDDRHGAHNELIFSDKNHTLISAHLQLNSFMNGIKEVNVYFENYDETNRTYQMYFSESYYLAQSADELKPSNRYHTYELLNLSNYEH